MLNNWEVPVKQKRRWELPPMYKYYQRFTKRNVVPPCPAYLPRIPPVLRAQCRSSAVSTCKATGSNGLPAITCDKSYIVFFPSTLWHWPFAIIASFGMMIDQPQPVPPVFCTSLNIINKPCWISYCSTSSCMQAIFCSWFLWHCLWFNEWLELTD